MTGQAHNTMLFQTLFFPFSILFLAFATAAIDPLIGVFIAVPAVLLERKMKSSMTGQAEMLIGILIIILTSTFVVAQTFNQTQTANDASGGGLTGAISLNATPIPATTKTYSDSFFIDVFADTSLSVSYQDGTAYATLIMDDGTAIGLGLANAANMLTNSDAESKIIILLTDGVNNAGQIDPLTAAEAANALGIKIYTIGAARPGQVPVPVQTLLGGSDVVYQESVLDEEILQQVADITGGKYYRAEDTTGLRAIYDEINQLEKSEVEVQVFNQYTELAGYLLVPALLILLLELVLRKTAFQSNP